MYTTHFREPNHRQNYPMRRLENIQIGTSNIKNTEISQTEMEVQTCNMSFMIYFQRLAILKNNSQSYTRMGRKRVPEKPQTKSNYTFPL
jgi:hypothetical protein